MTLILYELKCGHIDQGPMRDAQMGNCFCRLCNTRIDIEKIVYKEWCSKCYDCRHKKWWGLSERIAKEAARQHWLKNNSHRASHALAIRPASIEAIEMFSKRFVQKDR